MTKLNLHCEDSYKIGLIGSLELFGYMAGCLLFAPLSDTYGRRKFLVAIIFVYYYNFLTLLFANSLTIIYPTFVIAGIAHSLKAFVVYVLMIELVPGKEALVTGLFFFIDGLSCIYCPLIFLYLTKETFLLFIMSTILLTIGTLGFMHMRVSESLKWLLF